jgi:hypothetical protein
MRAATGMTTLGVGRSPDALGLLAAPSRLVAWLAPGVGRFRVLGLILFFFGRLAYRFN